MYVIPRKILFPFPITVSRNRTTGLRKLQGRGQSNVTSLTFANWIEYFSFLMVPKKESYNCMFCLIKDFFCRVRSNVSVTKNQQQNQNNGSNRENMASNSIASTTGGGTNNPPTSDERITLIVDNTRWVHASVTLKYINNQIILSEILLYFLRSYFIIIYCILFIII